MEEESKLVQTNNVNKKSQKKGFKTIIILLCVLLLISIGFYFFIKKVLTAEYYLERSVKKINTTLTIVDKLDSIKQSNLEDDYLKIKTNAKINTNIDSLKELNDLSIESKSTISLKDEYLELLLNFKQNEGEIPLNLYLSSTNLYFESKDINLNLVNIPLDYNPFNNIKDTNIYDNSFSDILYVIQKLVTYFKDSLSNENIITNNNGTLFNYKYIIKNENNDSAFIKQFIKYIKEDQKLMKILELEDDFDQTYFNSNNYISNLEISIIHNPLKNRLEEVNINIENKKKKKKELKTYNLKLIKDNNYKLTLDNNYCDITNNNELSFKCYDEKDNLKLDLSLNNKPDFKISSSIYFDANNKLEFNIAFKLDSLKSFNNKGDINYSTKDGNIKLTYDTNVQIFNDSVNKADLKNAKSINDLTKEEIDKINSTLEEKMKQFSFIKTFESYSANIIN